MFALERRRKIMEVLYKSESIKVFELSQMFNVSMQTIRKDIEVLESRGILIKTYGGAVLAQEDGNSFNCKKEDNYSNIFENISKVVTNYINDDDIIFLDWSILAIQVAKKIKDKKRLTIVSNSNDIINEFINQSDYMVINIGGEYLRESGVYIGVLAKNMLERICFEKAVITYAGFDIERGVSEVSEFEAEIKKKVVEQTKHVYLMIEKEKIGRIGIFKAFDADKIDILFTNGKLPESYEHKLMKKNINIVYC